MILNPVPVPDPMKDTPRLFSTEAGVRTGRDREHGNLKPDFTKTGGSKPPDFKV